MPAMRRPSLLPMVLLLGWGLAAAQTAPPRLGAELAPLLAFAREHNPEYAGMRHESTAFAARIEPAGALPDPRFRFELMDVTRGGEQNPTLLPGRAGGAKYSLMQEFPWFGKRELRREIATAEAQGARDRARGTWSELAARIKGAFGQAAYLAQNQALTLELLDLARQFEAAARERYAAGLGTQNDVLRAQLEITTMRNELVMLDSERHHQRARLNLLLGRNQSEPLADPETLPPLSPLVGLDLIGLLEQAAVRNPLLAAENARVEAAEKAQALTLKNRYPDLALSVAPTQMDGRLRNWDLMLELSIPLQWNTRRAQEREAGAMLDAARARQAATANQLRADLAENLSALDAARQTERRIADIQVPQAQLALEAAQTGLVAGKVEFGMVLEAQRALRQARIGRLKAQVEAYLRATEIERLLGEE